MSNDHYVPQFYLGNFSPDHRNRDCVCLINISHRKFVPTASIKGQCKKAGFHEYKPGLEAALSQFEGLAASAIRNVVRTSALPTLRSPDHEALAVFTAIQRSRTLKAAEASDKAYDRIMKIAREEEAAALGIDLSKYEIKSQYPVAIPLNVAANISPIATQLSIHLFVNDTSKEFVTSDDPVIAHNQYCEGIESIGVLGWNCAGIQVFLPLSPRHVMLLYDARVYAVGGKRNRDVSQVTSESDVSALNALQIANARENIYFHDAAMAPSLLERIKQLSSRRGLKRLVTVQSEGVAIGDRSNELIHFYQRLLPIQLCVSNIRIKRNMRRIPLHHRATLERGANFSAPRRSGRADIQTVRYVPRRYFSD